MTDTDKVSFLTKTTYKEQVARSNAWGHHFLFLNIILALVSSFTYVYAAPSTSSFLSFFYLAVTYLGHTSFLCFIAYLVIFFPLSFIGNFRYYRVFSVIIAILLHTILLFDLKLYLTVKIHLSLSALNLMFTGLDFNTGLNYNFLYLAIPLVIVLQLIFSKLTTRYLYRGKHNLSIKIIVLALTASFIASHSMHIWADVRSYEKITALRSTFPLHYPMTARSFLLSHGYIKDNELKDDAPGTAIVYPLETIESKDLIEPVNIISISLNGLTHDLMDSKNTPYLDALKSQSLYFDNFYLPYNNLSDNIFSAAYGLPVSYRASIIKNSISPVLLSKMHSYEYLSKVFISSPKYGELQKAVNSTGLRQAQAQTYASDYLAMRAASDYIQSWDEDRTHNLYIMLNDSLKPGISKDGIKARIAQSDKSIKTLVENIKNSAIGHNTIIIITAMQGQTVKKSRTIYDRKAQRVPLFIIYPDNRHTGIVSELATTYDLSPTILSECFLVENASSSYSVGYDLNALPDREFLIFDRPELLLVSKDYITVYMESGQSYVQKDDKKIQVKANLENLIQAMIILNRFKE